MVFWMTVKMNVTNCAAHGMERKPTPCLICRLLALPLTLRAEIWYLHPNPYFLKDSKGYGLDQGPFLSTGLVPVLHIPDQDQGHRAVDPLQGII